MAQSSVRSSKFLQPLLFRVFVRALALRGCRGYIRRTAEGTLEERRRTDCENKVCEYRQYQVPSCAVFDKDCDTSVWKARTAQAA